MILLSLGYVYIIGQTPSFFYGLGLHSIVLPLSRKKPIQAKNPNNKTLNKNVKTAFGSPANSAGSGAGG